MPQLLRYTNSHNVILLNFKKELNSEANAVTVQAYPPPVGTSTPYVCWLHVLGAILLIQLPTYVPGKQPWMT